VVRDSNAGPEVLMLKRSKDLKFAGGMWVFPGGRIDTEDFAAAGFDPDTERDLAEAREGAARQAAVREAAEEADLVIELSGLRRWSHWTPPPRADNRFTTAFFVAVVDGGDDVTVDDGEIREHRWMRPTDVIEARDAGEIGLAPPTYITLHQMQGLTDAAAVLDAAVPDGTEPEHFATRFTMVGNDVVAMYFGDVAYEDVELVDNDGPRHRLVMGGTWSYARDPGLTQQR
jgi:8-oxo-dGTP pyrophosphatase MutT (NUDIX family)